MKHTMHPAFSSPIYSSFMDVSTKPSWSTVKFHNYGEHDTTDTNTLLERPEWSEIKNQINEHVNNYFFNVLKMSPGPELYINISWASRSGYKQYHHMHTHPNSLISGTVYFDDQEYAIVFHKSLFSMIECDTEEFNIFNCGQLKILPRKGEILLWPSHLQHFTETVTNPRHTRYSLSFNVWIKGIISKTHTAGLNI